MIRHSKNAIVSRMQPVELVKSRSQDVLYLVVLDTICKSSSISTSFPASCATKSSPMLTLTTHHLPLQTKRQRFESQSTIHSLQPSLPHTSHTSHIKPHTPQLTPHTSLLTEPLSRPGGAFRFIRHILSVNRQLVRHAPRGCVPCMAQLHCSRPPCFSRIVVAARKRRMLQSPWRHFIQVIAKQNQIHVLLT